MKRLLVLFMALFAGLFSLHAQTDDSYMPYRNPRTAHLFQVDTIEVDGITYERIMEKNEPNRVTFALANI